MCQWSAWSVWSACAEPCSGGVRQRHRRPLASPPGPRCRRQQTQSQSCNTGLCPGVAHLRLSITFLPKHRGTQSSGIELERQVEASFSDPASCKCSLHLYLWKSRRVTYFPCFPGERCEDRGRTYHDSCANQCPRSCTDLWEHVQCLQGACHSGEL